jgi:hypothetical protein
MLRLAILLLAAPAAAGALRGQVVRQERYPIDTLRQRRDTLAADTGRAGRGAGLPRRPSRQLQPPDSVVQVLMTRPGYRVTRYNADSVTLLAGEREIRLSGRALVERDGSTLEADSVRYLETTCGLVAVGSPKLFDRTGVMVGEGMLYDACNRAGVIARATTDFQEGSATWFLRGDMAVDNDENRMYAKSSTITSCELPDPHYHFAAREVKYISRRLLVSRPAVLYVGDVPVLWLPFIFQDMRRGRRSGFLTPQFGLNDIVRNSPSYQRHVASLGYYWALGDYADAQIGLDWYANRFTALNGRLRYRWLDRFIAGGLAYQEMRESGGSTSRRISWSHNQDFSLSTRLTAQLDYASSSRVVSRNAVDPVLAVATIDSRLNFQRRFDWGTLSLGGNRTQSLDKPQVTTSFPVVAFAPNPIAISRSITWSPGFNFTNAYQSNFEPGALLYVGPGPADSLRELTDRRSTSFRMSSPLRVGRWNWTNDVDFTDTWSNSRDTISVADPDDTTRTLVRTYTHQFETAVNWNTGINLPVLFQGTWNLSPSVQIVNTTGGPLLVRNRFTGGAFVSQGKRLQYSASMSPTFFGLFGGIGPVARIRHSFSPSVSWSYAPAATVPEDYARATSRDGRTVVRRSEARQTVTIGLSQNFEAKLRPPRREGAADTAAPETPPPEGRKLKLLSIQSSGITFDIEQAKRPGRTGWVTDTWDNTFSSDLLRGFSLRTQHDLFEGPVGVVGSRFRPALTSVSMSFGLSAATLRSLAGLLGLRAAGPERPEQARADSLPGDSTPSPGLPFTNAYQRGPLATQTTALERGAPRGRGFSASISYSLQRPRPTVVPGEPPPAAPPENQAINASLSFSPTRHWSVSWQTDYNFTRHQFGAHVLRLDRDLHDWRATFSFVKSPNGNVLFNFFIQLIDQPDIKFEYDQRNIRR